MLWHVYVRSDSVHRLEYKALIQLIEENKPKVQRPQSSKPAASKAVKQDLASSDEDDKYSEVDEAKESGYLDSPVVEGGKQDLMTGGLAGSYEESPRQKVATSQREED
jgi:hypothetical protein